jgi:hypothetical protein
MNKKIFALSLMSICSLSLASNTNVLINCPTSITCSTAFQNSCTFENTFNVWGKAFTDSSQIQGVWIFNNASYTLPNSGEFPINKITCVYAATFTGATDKMEITTNPITYLDLRSPLSQWVKGGHRYDCNVPDPSACPGSLNKAGHGPNPGL